MTHAHDRYMHATCMATCQSKGWKPYSGTNMYVYNYVAIAYHVLRNTYTSR